VIVADFGRNNIVELEELGIDHIVAELPKNLSD
jgi:hypothetical protein